MYIFLPWTHNFWISFRFLEMLTKLCVGIPQGVPPNGKSWIRPYIHYAILQDTTTDAEMLRLWVKFTKEKQGGHITNKMKFPVFSPCYIKFPCLSLHKNYQLVSLIKSASTL